MKRLNIKYAVASIVLYCLIFNGPPCLAEQVIPSGRVKTVLNVREEPMAKSPIVGKLLPNEKAKHLDSVPYWYHVKLETGVTGYVSKAWAELVDKPQATDRLLRIGSWNIKKLGHGSKTNYETVAKIIESNFDVMAVIEVMQKGGSHPGYDKLIAALDPSWKGLVTDKPRPNTGSGNAEFYAILYRSNLVNTCSGWDSLVFTPDNDGSGLDSDVGFFAREPAFGCFEVPNNNGSVGFDFLLAGYHARWAHGNKGEIKEEVSRLEEVFQEMGRSRPNEADLIIAGDFNLVPIEIQEALNFAPGTIAIGSTLNSKGAITRNIYDHILVHNKSATQEMVDSPTVLDVTSFASNGKEFYSKVSDHLPVVARFKSFAIDDD